MYRGPLCQPAFRARLDVLPQFAPRAKCRPAKGDSAIVPMKNWLLASSVLLTIAVILLLRNYSRLGDPFHSHGRDRPKRRLFLAAIGFFVTFAVARAMVYGAYRNVDPFEGLHSRCAYPPPRLGHCSSAGSGFCWLIEVGEGSKSSSLLVSRQMSLLYGVGPDLTLDEFAL